jgi:hypothetical protein
MVVNMKVNSKMIREMDMVYMKGKLVLSKLDLVEINIKAIGETENHMVKGKILSRYNIFMNGLRN